MEIIKVAVTDGKILWRYTNDIPGDCSNFDMHFLRGPNLLAAKWVMLKWETLANDYPRGNNYAEVLALDPATGKEAQKVRLDLETVYPGAPKGVLIEPNYFIFRGVRGIYCVDIIAGKAAWKFDFSKTIDLPEDVRSVKGPINDTIFAFVRRSDLYVPQNKRIAPEIHGINLKTGTSERLVTLPTYFEPQTGGLDSMLVNSDSENPRASAWYPLEIHGMNAVLVTDYYSTAEKANVVAFHSVVDRGLLWKKTWSEFLSAIGVLDTNRWLGRFAVLGENALLIGPNMLATISPKTGDVIRYVPNIRLASPTLSIGELKYSAFSSDASDASQTEYLKSRLSEGTLKMYNASEVADQDNPWTAEKEKELKQALLKDLNSIIQGEPLYKKKAFMEFSRRAEQFLADYPIVNAVAWINRFLLESIYENNYSKALTFEVSVVESNRVFVITQHPNLEDKRLGIWLDESLKPVSAVTLSAEGTVPVARAINSAEAPFVNNLFQ